MNKVFLKICLFFSLSFVMIFFGCGNARDSDPNDPVLGFHLYQEDKTVPTWIHVSGNFIGELESYSVDGTSYETADFSHWEVEPGIHHVSMTVKRNGISATYSETFETRSPQLVPTDFIETDRDTKLQSVSYFPDEESEAAAVIVGSDVGYISRIRGKYSITTLCSNVIDVDTITYAHGNLEGSFYFRDGGEGHFYYRNPEDGTYTTTDVPADQLENGMQFFDWDGDGNLELFYDGSDSVSYFTIDGPTVGTPQVITTLPISREYPFRIVETQGDIWITSDGSYYSKNSDSVFTVGASTPYGSGDHLGIGQFDNNPEDYEWLGTTYTGNDPTQNRIRYFQSAEDTEGVTVFNESDGIWDIRDINNDGIDDILVNCGNDIALLALVSSPTGHQEVHFDNDLGWYIASARFILLDGDNDYEVIAMLSDKDDNTKRKIQLFEFSE